MEYTGVFIALEGINGSGKSTICQRLSQCLYFNSDQPVITADPHTETPLGAMVRNSIKTKSYEPMTHVLLTAAARADWTRFRIIPALNDGKIVLSDRYIHSTWVYQDGYADISSQIHEMSCQGLYPDLTIVLDVPADIAMQRAGVGFEKQMMLTNPNFSKYNDVSEHVHGDEWGRRRKAFLALGGLKGVEIVKCGMSSIDSVMEEVVGLVKPIIEAKLGEF